MTGPTANEGCENPSLPKGSVGLSCILCTAQFETPVIRESRYWRTVINRNQNLLGKLFIALRRHEEDVASVTPAEWDELREEIRWATGRLRDAFAPDHFNYSFLMNVDHHVHLHVIPRYVGVRSLAGLEFSDPDYPDAYRPVPSRADVAGAEVITEVAAALASPSRSLHPSSSRVVSRPL